MGLPVARLSRRVGAGFHSQIRFCAVSWRGGCAGRLCGRRECGPRLWPAAGDAVRVRRSACPWVGGEAGQTHAVGVGESPLDTRVRAFLAHDQLHPRRPALEAVAVEFGHPGSVADLIARLDGGRSSGGREAQHRGVDGVGESCGLDRPSAVDFETGEDEQGAQERGGAAGVGVELGEDPPVLQVGESVFDGGASGGQCAVGLLLARGELAGAGGHRPGRAGAGRAAAPRRPPGSPLVPRPGERRRGCADTPAAARSRPYRPLAAGPATPSGPRPARPPEPPPRVRRRAARPSGARPARRRRVRRARPAHRQAAWPAVLRVRPVPHAARRSVPRSRTPPSSG